MEAMKRRGHLICDLRRRYVPLTAPARFAILRSGEIDVLICDSALTARVPAAATQHERELQPPAAADPGADRGRGLGARNRSSRELQAKSGLAPREPANEASRRLLAAAAQGEALCDC